jgi:excisionase family DNA binding protein
VLTPQQVADELGVSLRTVQHMIQSGELPHIAITERNRRITRQQLDTYLTDLEAAGRL